MYVFELFQQENKITMIQLITDLIILQININRIKNKLEELKLLIHDTHAYIITIQEIKLTPKANTPKVHNFTTVRADRLHKAGGGLITLIRNNITFTTTDIPSTINTHNTEIQMVKVHINNTKHITIANIYIPPPDGTQGEKIPGIQPFLQRNNLKFSRKRNVWCSGFEVMSEFLNRIPFP